MSCASGLRMMLRFTFTRGVKVLLIVCALAAIQPIVLGTNNDGSLPGNTMTKQDDPNPSSSTSSTSAALTANDTGTLQSFSDQQQATDNTDWQHCSVNGTRPCEKLGGFCLRCDFNESCIAGTMQNVTCTAPDKVNCTGSRTFNRQYHCRYCYQMDHWLYSCKVSTSCRVNGARRSWPGRTVYRTECEVKEEHLCLGYRRFYRQVPCNWSSGYKWSTALILSITLGGFGVDRFYLGLWREAIGKLFSFGGLGVWTLVDVILIAVGYIGPSDGSLYI